MSLSADKFIERLKQAVETFDRRSAEDLCQELVESLNHVSEPFPEKQAKTILGLLRRKRHFDLMQQAADAFIQSGQDALQIRRQYAQALLDQGNITAALNVLNELMAASTSDPGENAEARGLVGRAYKQLYLNANDPTVPRNRKWLERSAKAYYDTYLMEPAKHRWHGINTVALLCRGARDQVPLPGLPDPKALAQAILSAIEADHDERKAALWDFSVAAEASIALDRPDEALKWTTLYAQDPSSDAFELASTLRQFREVWQIRRGSAIGERLLPILHVELLKRGGGVLQLSPDDLRKDLSTLADTAGLEKVFGADAFQSLDWLRTALERCCSVARIGQEASRGLGTGFVVRGRDLDESLGDERLLLTNSHVLSNDPKVPGCIRPEDAVVTFQGLEQARQGSWGVKEIIWTSPPSELDATLARLEPVAPQATSYPIAKSLPVCDGTQRVYIVGHPGGGTLSFSLQDNLLLDTEAPKLHYRTPTEGGSSGSPVFWGPQWKLVALHHAGKSNMPRLNGKPGTYEANEGIWIVSIIEALRKRLHG
jgi:hypothetical protein